MPLHFGEPLHHSPKVHADDEGLKSPPEGMHRHLDLEDFANSPAADAEDVGSDEGNLDGEEGHDVEMRVALG